MRDQNPMQNQHYDLIIKGGTLYDGICDYPKTADIGVLGDHIADIGDLPPNADKVIDATGLLVAPGFIDVHTHCDLSFKNTGWDHQSDQLPPSVRGNLNYLYQGVTTVVTGNCGLGYTDTEKWLQAVEKIGFGTNVFHLIPHGIVREDLFGKDQPQQLTSRQLSRLRNRIDEEMDKGAIGLSTGLEYYPGLISETEELVELCKVVRSHGGLYATHRRDETGKINNKGQSGVIQSTQEAIDIGNKAEIPVQISHLKIAAPHNQVTAVDLLGLMEDARNRGMDLTADQYPYNACNTYLSVLLPSEFKFEQSAKDTYRTKTGRKEIVRVALEIFSYLSPDQIQIVYCPTDPDWEGKTIHQIAENSNEAPEYIFTELVCEYHNPLANLFSMNESDIKTFMAAAYVFTASDGHTVPMNVTIPHPRCYGTFPRKISRYVVRDKILKMADAIKSMTSLPAEKFKLGKRGKLIKDYFADIVVFDPVSLEAKATYQQPHQYATGIKHLVVNGVLSLEDGKDNGKTAGKGLKR